MPNRVVITGVGPVSPVAVARQSFWKLFRSDADPLSRDPILAGEARRGGLRLGPVGTRTVGPQLRHMDSLARLAVAAVALAVGDSGLELSERDPGDLGVALGTGYGCLGANVAFLEGIRDRGHHLGNPLIFQNTVPNAATGYIAIAQQARGPNATFASGWTAGLEALDFAVQQIADGTVHAMIVASADSLCPQLVDSLAEQSLLSLSGVPRPCDLYRDGFVLSEGACALVLEERRSALRRGAPIYAEVVGMGHASDPGEDPPQAVASAVGQALDEAGLVAAQLRAIFSSANGSPELDRWESRGVQKALGDQAGRVATTCPKSLLGETLGSGGLFGATVAALAMASGWVPATAHYADPDPDCTLNVRAQPVPDCVGGAMLVAALSQDGAASVALLQSAAS
jgi:3-oxoacyl-(acyl-carrier-protein) synthase